jgi:hypothetical protein
MGWSALHQTCRARCCTSPFRLHVGWWMETMVGRCDLHPSTSRVVIQCNNGNAWTDERTRKATWHGDKLTKSYSKNILNFYNIPAKCPCVAPGNDGQLKFDFNKYIYWSTPSMIISMGGWSLISIIYWSTPSMIISIDDVYNDQKVKFVLEQLICFTFYGIWMMLMTWGRWL